MQMDKEGTMQMDKEVTMKWTKRRTLEVCRDLWQWLADNPDKGKWKWPEWEYNGGEISRCRADCPVCQHDIYDCDCCLLWGKGGELEREELEREEPPCLQKNSPYFAWNYDKDITVRREVALEIVAACNRALAKLKK